MYTVQYTLSIVHYTWCNVHYTLCIVHCTVYIVQCTHNPSLALGHWSTDQLALLHDYLAPTTIVYSCLRLPLYRVQCTLYAMQILYNVHCTHCTLYNIHTVHCTIYNIHTLQCTVYTGYTVYNMYIVHTVQCTI